LCDNQLHFHLTPAAGRGIVAIEILEGIRTMARRGNLILVSAVLVSLAGCTSVEQSLELRKPTARLLGVKIEDASLQGATLVFNVEVENHYATTVPALSFSYAVSSAGALFLVGSSEVRMDLPANGSRTVSLPARIDYVKALSALANVGPGATIPYEARVELTVNTPRLGPLVLAMSREGQLSLPTVSAPAPQPTPSTPKTE
jgi:LEA14-like dessication related protein